MTLTHEQRAARREAMAKRLLAGDSVGEVAASFGVGCETVYKAKKEYAPHHSAVPLPALSTYKIIAELLLGKPAADIATSFGISRQRVSLIRKTCLQAGIKMPLSKEAYTQLELRLLDMLETVFFECYQCDFCGIVGHPEADGHLEGCELRKVLEENV